MAGFPADRAGGRLLAQSLTADAAMRSSRRINLFHKYLPTIRRT